MITVVDYGMGNLRSVSKAFELLGAKVRVSSSAVDIDKAQKLVFPGVGGFYDCMAELDKRRLQEPLKKFIQSGRPFLGICMGLQLLFESSEEAPGTEGLKVLKGHVKRFSGPNIKVPHVGWNQVEFVSKGAQLPLLSGIENRDFFYFVHSYYAQPAEKEIVLATTDYGTDFCSVIKKNNIYATQFHPEKSQTAGMKLLNNFLKLEVE